MARQRIRYYLYCFPKEGDDLVAEFSLEGINLVLVRKLLGLPQDHPLVDSYPVGPQAAIYLQRFVPEKIDLNRYDLTSL